MSRALRNNARTLAALSFYWCWDWVLTYCVPVPSNHGPSGKAEAALRQLRDVPQEISLTPFLGGQQGLHNKLCLKQSWRRNAYPSFDMIDQDSRPNHSDSLAG